MRVTRLKLANVRAIEAAEFRFQPGINLVVGVNGVGKTTALDALGVCLASIIRQVNGLRVKSGAFLERDIRESATALTVECTVQLSDREYTYLIHKPRDVGGVQAGKTGMPREQVFDTPGRAEFVGDAPKLSRGVAVHGFPFGVLYSTRRAVASDASPSKGSAAGGLAGASAEAFSHRELRLADIAFWMRAKEAQKEERPEAGRVLDALDGLVRRFLPGYRNIRATGEMPPRLMIDIGETTTVRTDELTDQEQSQLKQAIEWADDRMALEWKPKPGLTERELPGAYATERASLLAEGLRRFLLNCENLRPIEGEPDVMLVDRKATTIEVAQLSDGERGILALVLDLTRRLAQANPSQTDAPSEAEAIVLIDEIDLHLHPRWQRAIVRNLTAAFPRCQFIVTTHSPQVIGEVEHDRIQIIADGSVYSPPHSFGMDSSQVLEEIMEADPRTQEIKELLSRISAEIGELQFARARLSLATLVERLGEDDPEVTRVRTLLDFMEGSE
jgi:hypothetical protein